MSRRFVQVGECWWAQAREVQIGMLAKPLLLIILAACAAPSGAAANSNQPDPDEPIEVKPPPEPPQEEGQHFCCVETNKGSGEGCVAISGADESINLCDDVLHCPGEWFKKDGNVVCVK
jgi:hypothetical protein